MSSVLGGHRRGVRRQGAGILSAATALDQQGEKQENVDREDRKENLFEPFAPILLRVAVQGGGHLKWIKGFQFDLSPANAVRAPDAASADTEINPLSQSANIRRTSAMMPAVKPTRSTACLMVNTATARKVWQGTIVEEK